MVALALGVSGSGMSRLVGARRDPWLRGRACIFPDSPAASYGHPPRSARKPAHHAPVPAAWCVEVHGRKDDL